MVSHDEADGGWSTLQVQGRDFGRMRHRRHFREYPGLSLLLQGRAGIEHLPRAEERRGEGCADVLRLMERMVPRSVAADRRGPANGCPINRQSGIESACSTPPGCAEGSRAVTNFPDRGGTGLPPPCRCDKG